MSTNLILHSSQQHLLLQQQQQVSSQQHKIMLKPNVNINRSLLVRSKKVKRIHSNGSIFSSIFYSKPKENNAALANIKNLIKEESKDEIENENDQKNKNNNSLFRIVRIARSNSTSSSSTTAALPTENEERLMNQKKRKIINGDEQSVNKRVKKPNISPTPPTAVDSISFKKILTISNELVSSNLNKNLIKSTKNHPVATSTSTPPPPLYKVSQNDQKTQLNNNKKIFEMPKLQPIAALNTNINKNSHSVPPKLKPILNVKQNF